MILKVQNLSRSFKNRVVFEGVSFEAITGENVALVGPNGSGKTTLLRCLSTLLLPDHGDAWFDGYSLLRDTSKIRAWIGWVLTHEYGFFPQLNGFDNLCFFGSFYGLSRKQISAFAARFHEFAVWREILGTPLGYISSGMKQCFHIVRSMLGSPRVLFLDEPTRSLDLIASRQVWELLEAVGESTLLVFSTHSPEELNRLARIKVFLPFYDPLSHPVVEKRL